MGGWGEGRGGEGGFFIFFLLVFRFLYFLPLSSFHSSRIRACLCVCSLYFLLVSSFPSSLFVEREGEKEKLCEIRGVRLGEIIFEFSPQVGFLSLQSLQPQATRTIPLDTTIKI